MEKTPQAFDPDRVSIEELAAYVERHVADTQSELLEALEQLAAILERNPSREKAAQATLASIPLQLYVDGMPALMKYVGILSSEWRRYGWLRRWMNAEETRDSLKDQLRRSQSLRAKRHELMKSFRS